MGSGKSTLGKKLAGLLNYDFVDLDTLIEERSGKSVPQIFKQDGEETFRKLESDCLSSLLAKKSTVVSLGGGTPCFNDNLEKIKKAGLLIYIELPAKTLAQRLRSSKQERPLLDKLNDNELLSTIERLMEQREKFYKQAHMIVRGLNLTAQDIYSALLEFSSKHNS